MKTSFHFLIVLLAMSIIICGCQKEDNNLESHLKLTKIAYNNAMEEPDYIFDYDDKGLVVRVKRSRDFEWMDVEYDSKGKPSKVGSNLIIWGNNEFTVDFYWGVTDLQSRQVYQTDSDGRIVKQSYYGSIGSDPSITNYKWVGQDSLYIERFNRGFKFNNHPNPMSSVNLAILIAIDFVEGTWDMVFQNKYCISHWGVAGFPLKYIEYSYNELGYPTRKEEISGADRYTYYEYN